MAVLRKLRLEREAQEAEAKIKAELLAKGPPPYNGYTSLVHTEGHPFSGFLRRCRYKAYRGGRGGAKCLAIGTLIIMADGTLRAIEDVRVGEQVMGPDKNPGQCWKQCAAQVRCIAWTKLQGSAIRSTKDTLFPR